MTPVTGVSYVPWNDVLGSQVTADLIATATGVIQPLMPVILAVLGIGLGISMVKRLVH